MEQSVNTPPAQPALLDARQAADLLNVSRSTFWMLHNTGKVPLPVRLSARVVRWRESELRQWLEAGCPIREKWTARKAT